MPTKQERIQEALDRAIAHEANCRANNAHPNVIHGCEAKVKKLQEKLARNT